MRRSLFLLAVASLLVCARSSAACTSFCYESTGTRVFGKNYDWSVEEGLVIVNKRNVTKTALTTDNPATWTSQYGSVTFNQYGREFPSGGINQKGLVIELMWLEVASYPQPDQRFALPTLQWIQYQLDNAATVDDVVASDATIRIAEGGSAKIHFLVADEKGNVAAIEYLTGRMAVYRGDDLPYPALTNDTYETSVAYARGVDSTLPLSTSSFDRFARAARGLPLVEKKRNAVDEAFALLDEVEQAGYTQWSIVYDIGERRAHFRTRLHREVRFLDLDHVDFSCTAPVLMVDVNAAYQGDVSKHLVEYSQEANRSLVRAAFDKTEFLGETPRETVEALARYPAGTACKP
jgi:choloylglycine hydrolase